MVEPPRDPVAIHDELIGTIEQAIAAAVSTSSGQMSEAEQFLADPGTPPGAFAEPIKPGPADPAAA